jgi:hypothetical protein
MADESLSDGNFRIRESSFVRSWPDRELEECLLRLPLFRG